MIKEEKNIAVKMYNFSRGMTPNIFASLSSNKNLDMAHTFTCVKVLSQSPLLYNNIWKKIYLIKDRKSTASPPSH